MVMVLAHLALCDRKATQECPCGYYGDLKRACTCTPTQINLYRARLSGPLLDRIDLHIQVPAVPFRDLAADQTGDGSPGMRVLVGQAREIQARRFARTRAHANSQMTSRQVQAHCALGPEARRLLEAAMERLGLSARAYNRILKIARTIADLAGDPAITPAHVAEAIQYRSLDRKFG